MKVLHILSEGGTGGIEVLVKEYARLSKHTNSFIVIWKSGINSELIKKMGNAVYELNSSHVFYFKTILRIINIIKKVNPNIIIDHHGAPFTRALLLMIKRLFPNIRIVTYMHSNAELQIIKGKSIKAYIINKISKDALNESDLIICISEDVKRSSIEKFRCDEKKNIVNYNGIDLNKFQKSIHSFDGIVHICFAGRLVEYKGVQLILRSLAQLELKNWDFTIIGDGCYSDDLKKITQDLGIERKVAFLGDRQDVPTLLRDKDIFVHACTMPEGFGVSIVEAMAEGKICICSKIGAIPELIQDDINGYLFTPGDIKALTFILTKVCNDIEMWRIIQENAVNSAAKFDIDSFSKRLDSILLDIN